MTTEFHRSLDAPHWTPRFPGSASGGRRNVTPHSSSSGPGLNGFPSTPAVRWQVDSGRIIISAPRPTHPAADDAAVAKGGGIANSSEAFEFLSATFGATLPRGHVSVVPSQPEDACSPLEPLATAAAAGAEGSDDSGGVGGGGGGGDGGGAAAAPPSTAVLVKRGGCSFGVKAKNVQVRPWCRCRADSRSLYSGVFFLRVAGSKGQRRDAGGVVHTCIKPKRADKPVAFEVAVSVRPAAHRLCHDGIVSVKGK